MPILNPQQAYNLLKYEIEDYNLLKYFLTNLLQNASKHYTFNRKTMDIHFKFYYFLLNNMKKCFDFFGFSDEDANKFGELFNCYNNIYNSLFEILLSKRKNQSQSYPLIELDFAGYVKNSTKNEYVSIPEKTTRFFIPLHNSMLGLFICTENYAVLTFNNDFYNDNNIFIVRLTTFLLAASGYTIVTCISDKDNIYNIPKLLDHSFFSETHIFTELKSNDINDYQNQCFKNKGVGYVYIYAHFKKKAKRFQSFLEEINNEYVKVFIFSKSVNKKKDNNNEIDSIFYAPDSVRVNMKNFDPSGIISAIIDPDITINLSNVALYKNENDITPYSISEIKYGTIKSSTFDSPSVKKIPIRVDNEMYYIDYEELHFLNPELYIKDPMYLSKENFDTTIVEKIEKTYQNNTTIFEKVKVKNSNIGSNIEEKMHNAFHYLHKYTMYHKDDEKEERHLEPYTSQIFAVYKAISYLSECTNKDDRGIILQVHTGEGKSYIIQALAEHLARQGNIVHIATSNIILAARDFMKSYNYFVNCERKASNGLKKQYRPSILIHQNELRYINKYLIGKICKDTPEIELFYGEENFNNPTNMNLTVCRNDKKIKSNIVYSTFLNFEAYYLSEHERNPYVSKCINKSYLIIDEADSILIDELTNGTILSKPMKSNSNEVLQLVYDIYTKNTKNEDYLNNYNDPEYVLGVVQDQFNECYDMTADDIQKMFYEIDKVKEKTFKDKYVIAEDLSNPSITKVFPYDFEHKGIIEVNKEFSGFIHQFIGINEKKENSKANENLEIQPLSLNYQFISHPTYVKMYNGICGVTGTIGGDREKEILRTYYGLTTSEVPRHQMSLRKDLPMIICPNKEERNRIIFEEILNFHKNGYPVLVVFLRVKEIKYFEKELIEKYHIDKEKHILKFTGKNKKKRSKKSNKGEISETINHLKSEEEIDNDRYKENDKLKMENESGLPYKITIGSNFCGRGVDIKFHGKPLCVIVSYYKEDQRSINQVLGRAGRNGYPGMARIICTKENYIEGDKTPEEKAMKMVINEFEVKKDYQTQFIDKISKMYPWLFNEFEFNEKLPKERALILRKCLLNINRITAYNFKFPVCMSVETFLNIQIQRIYSLKNCPECKYTWNLFRIYMRELILESWSLFLESVDDKFKKHAIENELNVNDGGVEYNDFFDAHYETFLNTLFRYIPSAENNSYIDTFFHIFGIVYKHWKNRVLNVIPKCIQNKNMIKAKSNSYTTFSFGFFPFCLSENSGCRLTQLTPELQAKSDKGNLYIADPELKYIKKNTKMPFSITIAIDKIFEKFQEVADEKLQGLFGIRFFLRRTLCGCEFGVCIDTEYKSCDNYLNCLIDRNPYLMFTICTKSTFIWIGGIMIIVLVFFASLCGTLASKYLDPGSIASNVLSFGKKIASKIFKLEDIENEDKEQPKWVKLLNLGFDKIIEFIKEKISSNLSFGEDTGIAFIIKTIMNLFVSNPFEQLDEKLNDLAYSRLRINSKIKKYLNGNTPFGKMIVVGVLIIIYLVTFLMNFKHRKRVKFESFSKENAYSFQKQDTSNSELNIVKFNAYKKINQKIEDTNNDLMDDDSDYSWSSDSM